jgi:hypothetical protein
MFSGLPPKRPYSASSDKLFGKRRFGTSPTDPPTCGHRQRYAINHITFSARYNACACGHHCAPPVLGG